MNGFGLSSLNPELAEKLDEGKGLAKTVADIKAANKRGSLHFAAREGQTEMCKYLLEELKIDVDTKDEDGDTPFIHAARLGHTDTAKLLLEYGANPSIARDLGATALHHSAGLGNIELLRYIISKGVDAGAKVNMSAGGATPLHIAADIGNLKIIKCLLKSGADPSVTDEVCYCAYLSHSKGKTLPFIIVEEGLIFKFEPSMFV